MCMYSFLSLLIFFILAIYNRHPKNKKNTNYLGPYTYRLHACTHTLESCIKFTRFSTRFDQYFNLSITVEISKSYGMGRPFSQITPTAPYPRTAISRSSINFNSFDFVIRIRPTNSSWVERQILLCCHLPKKEETVTRSPKFPDVDPPEQNKIGVFKKLSANHGPFKTFNKRKQYR